VFFAIQYIKQIHNPWIKKLLDQQQGKKEKKKKKRKTKKKI